MGPDAEIEGKGVVLISSEDDGEDDDALKDKLLKDFGLSDGSILSCDDFLQDYNVKVFLYQCDDLPDGVEYQVVGDIAKLKEQEKEKQSEMNGSKEKGGANGSIVIDSVDEKRKRPHDETAETT